MGATLHTSKWRVGNSSKCTADLSKKSQSYQGQAKSQLIHTYTQAQNPKITFIDGVLDRKNGWNYSQYL
jgi:hypothetical protein